MRNKNIWIFNSGLSFDGNPKWLFMYIVNHRPEIKPYWFCYDQALVDYMEKRGFKAYLFNSKEAKSIGKKAGVYVVNQRKEVLQPYFKGITILNLWHGVGCKAIEKHVTTGVLNESIAKKNIVNMGSYMTSELFLVTSPLMESHFTEHCRLTESSKLRGGYPCCFSSDKIKTYDHDILKGRGLPEDTKIAIYAPTYRENSTMNFFATAVADIEKLIETLKRNNMVLIFKLHPNMIKDLQYINIKKMYEKCPQLIFWDNANDVYEIMDRIDLAIIDYSSIFYDLLARGVKHFIRYIFDYDNKECVRDFALDYMEHTCGPVCDSFDSLLEMLSEYKNIDLTDEISRIKKLFWEYADDSSMDDIINAAKDYSPRLNTLPTLYSFDIFDTLLGRSTHLPIGVFLYVQDRMKDSEVVFPKYVTDNYFKVRPWCERDCREYYNKSQLFRRSDKLEITFDMIFEHMKSLYDMTDEQIALLKEWELEGEYRTSIPIKENIDKIKKLKEAGETVVLISDMYLPKEFVTKLLAKADPILAELPLFLSCECGHQKMTRKLFLEVYHSLDYKFNEWIHCGDNSISDVEMPKKLGIKTQCVPVMKSYAFEETIKEFIHTYDGYQIYRLLLDFRAEKKKHTPADHFVFRYASFYFVPYVNWVIRNALEKGISCLYFISRDGYHLKRIADAIIEVKKYNIKTKYIYGSRKAWRIPALINEIDEDFWSEYGQFAGINTYEHFLRAALLTDSQFIKMFPELEYLKHEKVLSTQIMTMLRETLKASETYCSYLLDTAKQKREMVEDYLKQEIDLSEKYAFVEFWARGYTQNCLADIIWNITGKQEDNIFYYARSIYPSQGNYIRYNFTANTFSMIFIESLFANLPYKSIESYEKTKEGIVPIMESCGNNAPLHKAMETYLPEFARKYASLDLYDEDAIGRAMFDFGLSHFHRKQNDPIWPQFIAPLKYSETMHGDPVLWAPPMKWKDIFASVRGVKFQTKNINWSLQKSSKTIQKVYSFYVKRLQGKSFTAKIRKLFSKGKN